MQKRILHISKFYEPYKGGIENICHTIVGVVKERSKNSRQIVICFNESGVNEKDIIDGVEVYRVAVELIIARQPISASYLVTLRRLLNSFKPNIIHLHAPNPLVAALLLLLGYKDCKLIVHWHLDIVAQKNIYRFIKPIESILLSRCDKIIATSPNYACGSAPLQRHKDKISILPNFIDSKKFKRTEWVNARAKELRASYNNKPIVLFVGRHVPYKGLSYLIEAIKYVKNDAVFLIGGSGSLTEELQHQAKALKNVNFLGRIADCDLVPMYYASDIFAFPSITKNEAFGVALAEAMYCDTPAVTFTINGSGVNWVNIHNHTGLEVPNADSRSFATALDTLIEDKELRERFSRNAKERVATHFLKSSIEKVLMESIYKFNDL